MTADRQTVSSVRLTASRSGNVPKRGLWRISVGVSLGVALVLAASAAYGAGDENAKPAIRIIPAKKHRPPSQPAPPSANEPAANQSAKSLPPAVETPPGTSGSQQPTVIPGLPGFVSPSRLSYYEIWRTIPFSHAEYAANPSYRHETTLGLLFNTMPVTQIIKQASQPNIQQYGYITPYQYNRIQGQSSMSYNFFYPHPSVYRQY